MFWHTFMTLELAPFAQQRVRASARGGFAKVYKSQRQKQEEAILIAELMPHKPEEPRKGSIVLRAIAYIEMPASWSKKKKDSFRLKPHIAKPDADNIGKHLCDCLTKAGFWVDDAQVYDICIVKMWADVGHWEIDILEDGE